MKGKLHTNDKIAKYFKDIPADKAGITIHHLLTPSPAPYCYTSRAGAASDGELPGVLGAMPFDEDFQAFCHKPAHNLVNSALSRFRFGDER